MVNAWLPNPTRINLRALTFSKKLMLTTTEHDDCQVVDRRLPAADYLESVAAYRRFECRDKITDRRKADGDGEGTVQHASSYQVTGRGRKGNDSPVGCGWKLPGS